MASFCAGGRPGHPEQPQHTAERAAETPSLSSRIAARRLQLTGTGFPLGLLVRSQPRVDMIMACHPRPRVKTGIASGVVPGFREAQLEV